MIWIFYATIFVIALLISLYKVKIKGIVGEKVVATILSGLNKQEYILINDVMLKTLRGTTQIDHVVVSIYGIFVIETKNYKGLITGTDFSDKWIKNMYGKKYEFYNPIKQNNGHIKALEKELNLSELDFISIIAFSPESELKVKSDYHVVYMSQVKKVIQKYNTKKFTITQINSFASKLRTKNIVDRDTRKEHVIDIRTKVASDNENISKGICPKCGGKLVVRKGKYGNFKGCSNFPKCRFIVK